MKAKKRALLEQEAELIDQEARRVAKNIVNSTDNLYEAVEAAHRLQKIYRRATEILEDFTVPEGGDHKPGWAESRKKADS